MPCCSWATEDTTSNCNWKPFSCTPFKLGKSNNGYRLVAAQSRHLQCPTQSTSSRQHRPAAAYNASCTMRKPYPAQYSSNKPTGQRWSNNQLKCRATPISCSFDNSLPQYSNTHHLTAHICCSTPDSSSCAAIKLPAIPQHIKQHTQVSRK